MITYNEALAKVNAALQQIPFTTEPKSLYEPIEYILDLGGKRIRPVLVLLGYNLYKKEVDTCLNAACAWEIFHNFTLLHDDLMDNADIRRGKTTVHKKWNNNSAILSGDAMLILAYKYMAKVEPKLLSCLLELFSTTADEICQGQQYDMEFESRLNVSEEEYLEMIRLKTAVMLGACLKTGALLADASSEEAEKLYSFGINMGLAFQLQDDLLDVFGKTEAFGKKIGGDISSNKKTLLLIYALQLAQGEDKKQLLQWLQETNPTRDSQKIEAVTKLYITLGVRQAVEEKSRYFLELALDFLHSLRLDSSKTTVLEAVAKDLTYRTS